ncbi:unnamed protein product [marine sediment metagenome]|uniref:Uncharacterized protein n=1 Tax=marine sediment metagenome TaxID=412755 RepID=X1TRP8_9ZZZZ
MLTERVKLEKQIAHWTKVEKDPSLPEVQRNIARLTLVQLEMRLLSLDLAEE